VTSRTLLLVVLVLVAGPAVAHAYDASRTFARGSFVLAPEVGYGEQVNVEDKSLFTALSFANVGLRIGWLPWAPLAPGTPVHGAFELGLEPLYQQYLEPESAYFAGLGATFRYHFLALGRLVPFVELAAFAGGTNLETTEIRSDFTFLLWGGVGASFFVTDRTAIYAGYRYQHVSNGNTSQPNRGFESNTGVLGMSFFFE
jgi:hypothetical protein